MSEQPPPTQPWPPVYAPQPPTHPQAITVLVLGILAVVVCGLVGPFAWVMGNRVVAEIDAARGQVGGRTEATIGRVLGIVGTALLAAGLAFFLLFLVANGVMLGWMFSTGP